ncbi:MAG TPA: DUF305 domain-containing protein [Puia sp.]|uniref:DUF305 domain-containing protein n=1 Tax=Puia sp. TaxID=2045100 RepID=UPI0009292F05|nr:DUF305 domain-containing protein [Puia sp.]MBN8852706.1 DUF305 domain-containing protein [Sphingobacteriales bacterium]OJW55529.1 MAG: DUF305 domain-containing protein [Sphingobacteriales bacterium 50-39]HVU96831.1 DUF305 domain-containing protein [Puia sp.]
MNIQAQKEKHIMYKNGMPYKKLLLMIVTSFIFMYILMYAMVDKFSNVVPNVNQFYMAGLMTMPMLLIELIIMGGMYGNKKLNTGLIIAGLIGGFFFYVCIRQQAGVTDKPFLRSMIPHHAAAVLMVKKASLKDPEIRALANQIITSQEAEIQQMKAKLEALKK